MPVIRDSSRMIASAFRTESWKASDRMGRMLAAVPMLGTAAFLVDGVFKGFGKPGPFEGWIDAALSAPAEGGTEQVGHLALTVATLPVQLGDVMGSPVEALGGTVATAFDVEAAKPIGDVAANVVGAATAAGIAGLALAGGTPNREHRS